jgi:hypothetical protein
MANKLALIPLVLMLAFFSVPIASAHAASGVWVFIGIACSSPYDAPPAGGTITFAGTTVSIYCHSYGENDDAACVQISHLSTYKVSSFAGGSRSSLKGSFGPYTGEIDGQVYSPFYNSHGQHIAHSEADWTISIYLAEGFCY